jgi:putative membrane protein
VSDADGRWDSGDIQPGASFSARFQFPGKYNYLCRHHQGMTGTITVTDNVTQPGGAAVGVGPAPGSGANRLPNEAMTAADADFLKEAISGGMLAVKLGQLAGERAATQDVRRFAERLVVDHTNINRDLMTLAERRGVSIPKDMNKDHQAALDKFKELRGADFDRSYIKAMVKDHEEGAKAFEKQSKDAKDEDLKAVAARVLPFVKNHLTMARETEAKVKAPEKQ